MRGVVSLALEALRDTVRAVAHAPTMSPRIIAAPAVIHYLQSRPDLIAETQTRLGRPLALEIRDGMAGFLIQDGKS